MVSKKFQLMEWTYQRNVPGRRWRASSWEPVGKRERILTKLGD